VEGDMLTTKGNVCLRGFSYRAVVGVSILRLCARPFITARGVIISPFSLGPRRLILRTILVVVSEAVTLGTFGFVVVATLSFEVPNLPAMMTGSFAQGVIVSIVVIRIANPAHE